MADLAVFRSNGDETYDLWIDGRAAEYDVEEMEFGIALKRRRVPSGAEVYVEQIGGARERLRIRR